MSHSVTSGDEAVDKPLLRLIVEDHQDRIAKLEDEGKKTLFKRMTASASASALFLGLVLTFASLYDTFIVKPETDRVSRISQFNDAVNSAAKIRQELISQLALQKNDPQLQFALTQAATPQILNNVFTARAILREMSDNDVGVPQLIILIYESFTARDFESAKVFVNRAVNLKDVSPYLHSEAKRYEGRYFFLTGNLAQARKSYADALATLGDVEDTILPRATLLADQAGMEFMSGDCENASTDLNRFVALLPKLDSQSRAQLASSEADSLHQTQGHPCSLPDATFTLLAQ